MACLHDHSQSARGLAQSKTLWRFVQFKEQVVSLIKSKIRYVIILHDVLLGFEAQLASAFGFCLAAGLDEVRKADDLCADEPLLDVRVDRAGSLPGSHALPNRPCAVFLSAHGEKAEISALSERADHQ